MKRKLSFTTSPPQAEERDSDTGKECCCSSLQTAMLLAHCHVCTLPPGGLLSNRSSNGQQWVNIVLKTGPKSGLTDELVACCVYSEMDEESFYENVFIF